MIFARSSIGLFANFAVLSVFALRIRIRISRTPFNAKTDRKARKGSAPRLSTRTLASSSARAFSSFQRSQRPQRVLDRREPRAYNRVDHFSRRLVARRRFVDRNAAVCVHHDPCGRVLVVYLALVQSPPGFTPGHSAARPVIYRVAAGNGSRSRSQDIAPIRIRARNQNRMPCVFPHRSIEGRMPGRKSSSRALAMHPHFSKLRVTLRLHEIVRNLIDQFQLAAEHLLESFGYLLEDDQAVEDRKVPARGDGVQVASIVLRLRREVTEIKFGDHLRLLRSRKIEVVSCQPMPPASRAGVRLHEQCPGFLASLQLDEVISTTKRA